LDIPQAKTVPHKKEEQKKKLEKGRSVKASLFGNIEEEEDDDDDEGHQPSWAPMQGLAALDELTTSDSEDEEAMEAERQRKVDEEEARKKEWTRPCRYDRECEMIIKSAWNYIELELGNIEVGDHAVVFEIDDCLLSSFPTMDAKKYQVIPCLTHDWLRSPSAPAIAPVLNFFNELRDGGATIFLVTRRPRAYRMETEQNLASVGCFGYEQLIMMPDVDAKNHVPIAEYKSRTRAWISKWYTIIMTVGDQECDVTGCSVGKAIKLPNHLYILE